MALHNNNLKLLYLLLFFFSSLFLPIHLAQPTASPDSDPVASPGPLPAQGPSSSSKPAAGPSEEDYIDDEVDTQEFSISLPPSSSEAPSIAPTPDSDTSLNFEFDFSPNASPSSDEDPQLKKICDSTDHPSLCLSTVAPFLDGGEIDVQSILDVSIQAGAQLSKYAQATAQKLAGNPGNPPQHSSVLDDCKDGFETAAENYAKAGDALSEKDKGTMSTMLSAVITYAADCKQTISKESTLYGITDRLINMTSNCLAISSLMN